MPINRAPGCFYGNKGMFRVAPPLELKKLEAIFRHKALRMLLSKRKIAEEMIRMLSGWEHTGFNVFCGNRISPHATEIRLREDYAGRRRNREKSNRKNPYFLQRSVQTIQARRIGNSGALQKITKNQENPRQRLFNKIGAVPLKTPPSLLIFSLGVHFFNLPYINLGTAVKADDS